MSHVVKGTGLPFHFTEQREGSEVSTTWDIGKRRAKNLFPERHGEVSLVAVD